MTTDKERVKKWLKKIGRDRYWLAEQCGVSINTVNCWLSSKDRPVPADKKLLIAKLMNEQNNSSRGFKRTETVTLQFSQSEWQDIQEYLKEEGKSIEEIIEELVLGEKSRGAKFLEINDSAKIKPFA